MSAQKKPLLTLTRTAAASLTQYQLVDAAGAVATAASAALGAVTTDAATGDDIAVDVLGTTIALSGAAISNGAELEVGTDGAVVTKTTGLPVGIALQAAAAAGEPIEIFLKG